MDALGLFQRYRDDVYRLAASYTGSFREAEAVSRTVFLTAAQKELTPGSERDFLLRQTVKSCRRLRRFGLRRPMSEIHPARENGLGDVWQTVMGLNPEYRVVMYLRYYEDFTTEEIAQLLKIPRNVAAARLSRGRALVGKC